MNFPEELLQHAIRLLGNPPNQSESTAVVDLRRAISAAYYAVFHRLSEAAVSQIAPYTSSRIANRVHRWLDHREVKRICQEFALTPQRPPLRDLLRRAVTDDMQLVASNFIALQEARHKADYDLAYLPSWEEARETVEYAARAMSAWSRVEHTEEATVFVLSLFFWKNWQSER